MRARKAGFPSLPVTKFYGDWGAGFTFGEDWGCGFTFVGFVIFVIVGAVLWRFVFG
jgi:hypothetical protein